MNPTATRYAAADRPLTALLDAVPATGWASPSPCADWTAADVVGHLIDTQREFFGTHGVDLGPAPDAATDPAGAWRGHAERVAEALADDTVAAREFEGFFGPTTVGAAFDQFYVWAMVQHRLDIARAVGAHARLTDDQVDSM